MRSTAARIGGALSAAVAWTTAITWEALWDWMTAMLAAGALLLVAVVLFTPSETPARRLGRLIQTWRLPAEGAGHDPTQPPAPSGPSSPPGTV